MSSVKHLLSRSLLGAMIVNRQNYEDLTADDTIGERHFQNIAHKKAFKAIGDCIARGDSVHHFSLPKYSSLDKYYFADLAMSAAAQEDVHDIAHILVAIERIPSPFPDRLAGILKT